MSVLERHRSHAVTLLLMAGAAGLYLLNARNMVFMDPDEARCAMIARNILETGDWLVLRVPYHDAPYFDKPILYFWLLAGTFRVLGTTEFAARLLSAVAGALVVGATYQLGRLLLSPRAGWFAGLMLATSVMMIVAGRFVRMDLWLTAFVAWGVLLWSRTYFAGGSRWNLVGGYACLAAAVLTKGLIGVLLPFAAVGTFLLLRRDWNAMRRAQLLLGLGIIVALAGPWYAYMAWRFPGYPAEFFWKHHFLRASTGTFGRSEVFLYLPGVALAGFLPWPAFLVAAIFRALPIRLNVQWPRRGALALCCCWAAWGVIPFAFSRTQLPVYIIPAFPALALIAGDLVDRLLDRGPSLEARWIIRITLVLMALSLVGLALIHRYTFHESFAITTAGRAAVFVPLAGLVWWLANRGRLLLALHALLLMTAAMGVDAAWREGPAMLGRFSSHRFVQPMRAQAADADLLVIGPSPKYALPFYLARPMEIRFVQHIIDFADYLDYPRVVAAVMTGDDLFALARANLDERLRVLDRRGDVYLVRIEPPVTTRPALPPRPSASAPAATSASPARTSGML